MDDNINIIKFNNPNTKSPKKGLNLYKEGLYLYNQEKYNLALKKFLEAEKLGFESEELYSYIAFIYNEEAKNEIAKKYLNKAIKLNNEFGYAYYLKGYILLCEQNFDESLSNYFLALKYNYYCPEIYYNIALIYNSKPNPENMKSMAYASIGIRKFPNSPHCYEMKGSIYYYQEEYKKALEYFEKAKNLGLVTSKNLYFKMAHCYNLLNDNKKSLEYLNKEIFLDKKDAYAYFRKGFVLYELEEYENALTTFLEADKLDPNNKDYIDMYSRISWIYQNIKEDHNLALKYADIAIKLNNKNGFAQYRKACVLTYAFHEYSKALKYFKKAYILDKTFPELFFDFANTYLQVAKYKLAKKYILEGLKLSPHNLDLLKLKVIVLFKEKQLKKVQQILKYLLKAEPNEEWNIEAFGVVSYEEKNYKKALKYFNKLTKPYILNYSQDKLAILSIIYYKLGQNEKSLNQLLEYSQYKEFQNVDFKDKIQIRSILKKLEKIYQNDPRILQIKQNLKPIL